MALTAPKLMTFEEFASLNDDGRYELVNGRLEELPVPKIQHGIAGVNLVSLVRLYVRQHQPGARCVFELDVPTLPFFGRRPDLAYYSARDAVEGTNVPNNQSAGRPTLVIEVLSEDDPGRDLVTKRAEYARAGIPNYWIVDPRHKSMLMLRLRPDGYEVAGEFSGDEIAHCELFPGLEIPLAEVFDW